LTAQLISLPVNRPSDAEILNTKIPNVHICKLQYHDDYLRPGSLQGNYFTIAIRTKTAVNEGELAMRLNTIEKFGILNYYQKQRFGGLRLENHNVGKLLMRGNFELAVRYILFKTNDYEMPIIREIKKQAEAVFPDYVTMIKIFEKLPFSFFYELKLVEFLKDNPNDFIGALGAIKESATICVYAYASLLFNKYLSVYTRENGCVDEEFPLLISPDKKDHEIYAKYLKEDGVENFYENLRKLKFIFFAKRTVIGRVQVQNIKYKLFDGGVVVSFYLSKGSYATTFLANLFELIESDPVPEWVKRERLDILQLMGRPGLGKLKEIFGECWA
jgi:tRNA(Glu) U13 pseudouridine synthase TruD